MNSKKETLKQKINNTILEKKDSKKSIKVNYEYNFLFKDSTINSLLSKHLTKDFFIIKDKYLVACLKKDITKNMTDKEKSQYLLEYKESIFDYLKLKKNNKIDNIDDDDIEALLDSDKNELKELGISIFREITQEELKAINDIKKKLKELNSLKHLLNFFDKEVR